MLAHVLILFRQTVSIGLHLLLSFDNDTMLLHRAFVIAATFHAFSLAQECPELPDTGVSIGEPVPIHPEHIPAGCSDFEVLVGMVRHPQPLVLYAHNVQPAELASQTMKAAMARLG